MHHAGVWELHGHPLGIRWDFLTLRRNSKQKAWSEDCMAECRGCTIHRQNFNLLPSCWWMAWETSESVPSDLPSFHVWLNQACKTCSKSTWRAKQMHTFVILQAWIPSMQIKLLPRSWSMDTWATFPTRTPIRTQQGVSQSLPNKEDGVKQELHCVISLPVPPPAQQKRFHRMREAFHGWRSWHWWP